MKNKQGISLIVLVITIIVMVILAAAVVITLSNTGIINKANEAVNKTNKKQIEQLATLAWSEAFMDGARTEEEFKKAVDEALKDVDTSGYEIIVTDKGVTVQDKEDAPKLNEYGFYYNQLYTGTIAENPTGIEELAIVFYAGGASAGYVKDASLSDKKILKEVHGAGELNYTNKLITMGESELTVSEDGLTMTGVYMGFDVTVNCTFEKMHGAYRNRIYSATLSDDYVLDVVLYDNNTAQVFNNGTAGSVMPVTLSHNDHLIMQNGVARGYLSTDGEVLYAIIDETPLLFTLTNRTASSDSDEDDVSAEWEVAWVYKNGAWSDAISKGGDATGDFVAKLYPLNKTVQPVAIEGDSWTEIFITNLEIKEGTAYKMVVEGTGEIPDLYNATYNDDGSLKSETVYAWQEDTALGTLLENEPTEQHYTYYITDIYVSDGITGIGKNSFAYMPSVQNVELAYSVEKIGEYAFTFNGIETLVLPNTIKEIGNEAFSNSGLKTITLPSNLTTMGDRLFYGCDQITNVTLPLNITEIPTYMFNNCGKLTNIDIPDSVTKIGDNAFSSSGLTTINWPSNLRTIEGNAFAYTNIVSANIPNTVTTIDSYAFYKCPELLNVTVPSSVTSMQTGLFASCNKLQNITFNAKTIPSYCFRDCISITSVVIPSNVIEVGTCSFEGCTGLMTVDIRSTQIKIGASAFTSMPSGSTIYVVKNAQFEGMYSTLKEVLSTSNVYCDPTKTTVVER